MSAKSSIEWTDATWNPLRGCTKVSPGCKHCYASTFAERFRGVPGHPYEQGFDLRLVPEKLAEPLRWAASKVERSRPLCVAIMIHRNHIAARKKRNHPLCVYHTLRSSATVAKVVFNFGSCRNFGTPQ